LNEQIDDNGFILSQQFYRKFQEPTSFTITGESDTYTKVTGLTATFSHTEPLLYKIKFDAICYNPSGKIWVFPRIMVNDYLIYNDKVIQNIAYRYKLIPGLNIIDVAVRGKGAMPIHIYQGVLTIELVRFHKGANIGDMAPVNVTSTNSNG
jgi:hypothetical protein